MAKQHVWKKVQLPSRGVYYGDKLPDGAVLIRKFTVEEEQILQSQGLDGLTRMARIISLCSKHPEADGKLVHEDLLITDRMALLIFQRILTFGARYTFGFRCQSCGAQAPAKVNLVEDFDEDTPDVLRQRIVEKYPEKYEGVEDVELTEPFEVVLEDVGGQPVTLQLRLLRGKDEETAFKRAKRQHMRSLDSTDPSYSIRLAAQIVTINGTLPETLGVAEQFVRGLTATDSARIRIVTEEREPGLDTEVIQNCKSCGFENRVPLQFDLEFFRPSRL